MMRFTIYDGNEAKVSLEEEVTYLKNFIELQTARYHKKVEVNFIQNIDNAACKVPPLLFINLVENAFKHGVEGLIDGAFVHIELEEFNGQIIFTINNN